MKTIFAAVAAAFLAVFASSVSAADLGGAVPVAGQCTIDQAALLGVEDKAELKQTIVQLMDDAVNVADDPRWIGSGRPVFLWASEAKFACGKAFGYLRSGTFDAENIYKCECFHARMTKFMN